VGLGAEFLTHFFQDTEHQVELRALPCKARVFTRTPKAVADFLKRNSETNNIYFGVATRAGHGGTKEHCREIPAIWVDVDFKDTPEAEFEQRLADFKLSPSVIVASGGGLHVYWLLKTPVSAQDARVEPILRGLALALGGDLAAAEKARVLRLPGTLNHKYAPPRKVELRASPVEWERRYLLEDFSAIADSRPTHAASAPVGTDGKIPEGQRNVHLTSLAGTMRARGMSQDAILAALLAENAKCCEPPLSEAEVRAIAKSIGRKGPSEKPPEETRTLAELRRFSDINPEPLLWLWPGRIPLGKLMVIAGDAGLGKSLLTIDIAARVSTGAAFPDGAACAQGSVIFLSAEDDAADTIRPRLDAAGADVSRIHLLEAVRNVMADGKSVETSFNLGRDVPALEDALRQTDARLVVIDPVSAYAGDTDTNNNSAVRGLLSPLAALARKYRVAVVAVTHLRKSAGPAIHRIVESLAFSAAARAAWGVAPDPDNKARRLFAPIKQNLSPDTGGLAYQIIGSQGIARIVWEPGAIAVDVNAVMSGLDSHEADSERREASEWLRDFLADGPRGAADVRSQSRLVGLTWITVRRAADSISIVKRKVGGRGAGWEWALPGDFNVLPFTEREKTQGIDNNVDEEPKSVATPKPVEAGKQWRF
jgi:archaellum biogenesis ATPase FlaH